MERRKEGRKKGKDERCHHFFSLNVWYTVTPLFWKYWGTFIFLYNPSKVYSDPLPLTVNDQKLDDRSNDNDHS